MNDGPLYRAIRKELKHLQEAPLLQAMEKEMARSSPDMGTLRYNTRRIVRLFLDVLALLSRQHP